MMMTFGTAGEMIETRDPQWIRSMIQFMQDLNAELDANGELIDAQGLVDGTEATTVRFIDGMAVPTDGPLAEAKESLVGYWILDVASHDRAVEIASRVTTFCEAPIELRAIADGPPEV
jgi:hypothetical protein